MALAVLVKMRYFKFHVSLQFSRVCKIKNLDLAMMFSCGVIDGGNNLKSVLGELLMLGHSYLVNSCIGIGTSHFHQYYLALLLQ